MSRWKRGGKSRTQERAERENRRDAEYTALGEAADGILASQYARVERFLEIAYRKVATPDEYGDAQFDLLERELTRFIKKLSNEDKMIHAALARVPTTKDEQSRAQLDWYFGHAMAWRLIPILEEKLRLRFHFYYNSKFQHPVRLSTQVIDAMSGADFEGYLVEQLRTAGARDVATTPKGADQGGDILFRYRDLRVVVQAKRHKASVGNKAVQEAHAAKTFYDCDRAWVATTGSFTNAARQLASRVNVALAGRSDVRDFSTFFRTYFAEIGSRAHACYACSVSLPHGCVFCPNCGSPQLLCASCETPCDTDASFCSACGSAL